MPDRPKRNSAVASPDDFSRVIKGSLDELRQAIIKAENLKFFANGIELIEISIKLANIEVAFKVAGPKAPSISDAGTGSLETTR